MKRIPPKLLVAVYNNTKAYPDLDDVAKRLKITPRRLLKELAALSDQHRKHLSGRNLPAIPISEGALDKESGPWTKEQCIAELLRVVNLDLEKVVNRNYFRVHGRIRESVWNQHFGTFLEFKRQANITLSRSQHKLEREIAKHASVDHYRNISVERQDWGDKYQRPMFKRFKTALIFSDIHDKEVDRFYKRVLHDTNRRLQSDYLILGGDGLDLPEFGKYTVDPREWDVTGRISYMMHEFIKPLRNDNPKAQFDWIEGNHEARLIRHLADASPAMRAILADLHGMTVQRLFGLDTYEINYIARADLAAWTVRDHKKELASNYKIYEQQMVVHHYPYAQKMGMPGVNGHNHKHQVWPHYSPLYGPYEWHQLGCGHKRSATFCEGEFWGLGFMIAHMDTKSKTTNFEYVPITDHAVVGGKWYTREDSER
jgi:hypothetical protein